MHLTTMILGIVPPPKVVPTLSAFSHSRLWVLDVVYGALLLWGALTVGIEMLVRKPKLPELEELDEDDAPEVSGERR